MEGIVIVILVITSIIGIAHIFERIEQKLLGSPKQAAVTCMLDANQSRDALEYTVHSLQNSARMGVLRLDKIVLVDDGTNSETTKLCALLCRDHADVYSLLKPL